jgi:hypothetical protein
MLHCWSSLIWYKVYETFHETGSVDSNFRGRKSRRHGDVRGRQLTQTRNRKNMTKTSKSLWRRKGETGN